MYLWQPSGNTLIRNSDAADVAARNAPKKKRSIKQEFLDRVNEIRPIGTTPAKRPHEFPTELVQTLRLAYRKIWDARGGGL